MNETKTEETLPPAVEATRRWLEANDVKPYAFARKNDLDPSDFNKFVKGQKRSLSFGTIMKIVKGTSGAVTAEMFEQDGEA